MRADGSEIPVELTITAIGDLPDTDLSPAFIRDLTERRPRRAGVARKRRALSRPRGKRSTTLSTSMTSKELHFNQQGGGNESPATHMKKLSG